MNTRLFAIAISLLGAISLVAYGWLRPGSDDSQALTGALLYTVERGDFESTITEPGDLESASNIDVRCRVRSRGTAGASILSIVEEGTQVEEGEFLVQFDDSVLKEELIAQKIQAANDSAAVIQAESDLQTAESTLLEYQQGIYEQERALIESEVAFAEETLRRAEEYYRHSKRLSVRGYVTDSQLEADEYAVIKASKELELAQQKLEVFERFTRERMVAELQAEIEKQNANLTAARFTLELSQQREQEIAEQIENCRILAPSAGMVVYANDNDRGDASIVIEEGVLIRDGQVVIQLPDPSSMQVVTHVNDSKINLVKEGDRATIWLDTDPETPIAGEVAKVAGFPLPRRWYQAPIEYEVFVRVTETKETVRPGLRAKVQVFVEDLEDVVQAPISSLVRSLDEYYVIIVDERGMRAQQVTVGPSNDAFVVVEEGLDVGQRVVIDGEAYRDRVEIPN